MKLQQIRNATMVVNYGGKKFLIDPMLADKGTLPAFPNPASGDERNNPLVELPVSIDELVKDLDAIFLSHLHYDHYDDAAKKFLPKHVKIYVQDDADKKEVESSGFTNVEVLTDGTEIDGIQLFQTQAQHGFGETLKLAGNVHGFVMKHVSEKTLYFITDSVWYEGVHQELNKHKPDIVVVNGGDNQFVGGGQLIMGKEEIKKVHETAPNATLVVSHMEGVNHNTLSRKELKQFLLDESISGKVMVPDDGQQYEF
ncbi:MBL fold metallo-hydrolase [Chryseobacterium bernardetii]|uniref:MBL fold metallo-hydrolase n=1 Tax=Chryseobacterium bernardetii TaxID=1241978 RepID=A0A3G6T211_9FLAO|nr:MBL fold metallo-hydrolase [Chryseobacterium bernardetii]AZB23402.1 MBL fold metallo-hydrolase [Chryseobacterium bernardetii]